MPNVKDTVHIVTLDAPEGDVKVVDYTDEETVVVFHSVKTSEIAEYSYADTRYSQDKQRARGEEYALGYVAGLQECAD